MTRRGPHGYDMARCRVDKSIERKEVSGFAFPLGVYPVEEMKPREGYACWFEPADEDADAGGRGEDEEGSAEWEEWPDRYVFDIAITATRLEALTRALFAALPGRMYPILDFLGHDAFREVDPYVSYELLGQERFVDALRRYRGFFFEDGLVGFGAMSEEPFMYVFVDEHKLITVRVETGMKERVESILAAFDLEELADIAGADSVTHEHRGVLDAPDDRPDLRNAEEIVEELIDDWGLVLNVDASTNVDAEGDDLGITGWRCVVRLDPITEEDSVDEDKPANGKPGAVEPGKGPARPEAEADDPPPATPPAQRQYAEILITAGSLSAADELAVGAARDLLPAEKQDEVEEMVLVADRVTEAEFRSMVEGDRAGRAKAAAGSKGGVTLPLDMTIEKVWGTRLLS